MKASPIPIILFIDEAHTMIGAGGQAGQNDAANLLKPALARGELRTIAATTWSEYKKYFEKDPALARRFQVVKVEEPIETQCMVMLRGIVPSLEKHHKVRILDEGLTAAVRLSHRYLAGPAIARQSGQRSRYRLCAAGAGPKRHSAGHRRQRPRRSTIWRCRSAFWNAKQPWARITARRLQEIATKSSEIESRLAGLRTRFEKERDLVTTIRDCVRSSRVRPPRRTAMQRAHRNPWSRDASSAAAAATAPALGIVAQPSQWKKRQTRGRGCSARATGASRGGPRDAAGRNADDARCVDAQIVGEVIPAGPEFPSAK